MLPPCLSSLVTNVLLSYLGFLFTNVLFLSASLVTNVLLSYLGFLFTNVLLSYLGSLVTNVLLSYLGSLVTNVLLSYLGSLVTNVLFLSASPFTNVGSMMGSVSLWTSSARLMAEAMTATRQKPKKLVLIESFV